MPEGRVLLIGSDREALNAPVVQAVLSQWNAGHRPAAQTATVQELVEDGRALDRPAVAWVVLREATCPGFYDLVGLLQDRQVPAMLTRPGDAAALGEAVQEGVVAAPPQAPPAALCAVLRALWSQVDGLRDLQNEVDLLKAQQIGLAGQIDRIDEELRLAAQLQREFLPTTLPQLGQVQFRTLYRPASYVSGDIFEVTRLDEDHVGLFLADAVGHGVPAALMTVFIKRALHLKDVGPAHPRNYRIVPPSEVLAGLNAEMMRLQAGNVRTATAWYGVVNCRTLELQYARAGHPLPLVLGGDGGSWFLEGEGPVLGVFDSEPFCPASVQLHPGDRVLVYSDGFETAFHQPGSNRREQRGLANTRYFDEFRRLALQPLDQALPRLLERLDEQAGSLNQVDDITAVCLAVDAASP